MNYRSESQANLDMQIIREARAFKYTPPPEPSRPFSWLSRLIIALCGF